MLFLSMLYCKYRVRKIHFSPDHPRDGSTKLKAQSELFPSPTRSALPCDAGRPEQCRARGIAEMDILASC